MNLKEQITDLVNNRIEGTDNFLVEVKVSPSKIIVSLDNPGGMKLDDCIAINKYLQKELESTEVFEKHELEVGSPGMEEPLKVLKQYLKRVGQKVSVLTFDGIKRNGRLASADEQGLVLDEEIILKTGKKKEIQTRKVEIPFTQIKETKVNFSFDKII
jgi:ribosome maturation factor RimP